ncbi:hypothetical protein CYMTET_37379 [Cymbomonas tetramitiformis]|uniref:Uncharacterized protein n=1 Tax=Cymbomonas tetramitiformis TaxID=36881 RepID=A0AAE0CG84_9CHLO|nr:hypothetical protein CYMTET_37379 [Cymbomonas tetramitiformis]
MITISYLSTTSVATSDNANDDDDAEKPVPRVHFCAKMVHEICFAMNPKMPAPSRTLSLLAGARSTKSFETRAKRVLGDEWKSEHCRRVDGRCHPYVTLELARVYAEAKDCDVAKLIAATSAILSWKRSAIIDHISPDLFETSATVADLLADVDDANTVASEPCREDENLAIDDGDGDGDAFEEDYDRIRGTRSCVQTETGNGNVPSRKRPRDEIDTLSRFNTIIRQFSRLDASSETAVYLQKKRATAIDSFTSVEVAEKEMRDFRVMALKKLRESRASVEKAKAELMESRASVEKVKAEVEVARNRTQLQINADAARHEKMHKKRMQDLEVYKQKRLADIKLEWAKRRAKRDRACKRIPAKSVAKKAPVVTDVKYATRSSQDANGDYVDDNDSDRDIHTYVTDNESETEPLPAAETAHHEATFERMATKSYIAPVSSSWRSSIVGLFGRRLFAGW